MRLHNNRIEELVTQLKQLNQRLTALEGQLLRMAEACKVNREDFLKHYRGSELDPNWLERVGEAARQGLEDLRQQGHASNITNIRSQIAAVATDAGLPISEFRRVYIHGQPRRARLRARQEGDDRGQPASGDLDRQEIHQSRPAIPGSDPGGQYRPDEGGG